MVRHARTELCTVDNRVFLLGLDELYRDAMKRHERAELLGCARRVVAALRVSPADIPVEGYYAEDQGLTEYFRLLRALQEVDACRTAEVAGLPEFGRFATDHLGPHLRASGAEGGRDGKAPVGRA